MEVRRKKEEEARRKQEEEDRKKAVSPRNVSLHNSTKIRPENHVLLPGKPYYT